MIINDFSIHVATINGSGSMTSNPILAKTLFRMGIPVGCKSIFPSNIFGLPTWYTIRVSKDGYVGRRKAVHIYVGLNEETFQSDLKDVASGGVVIYNSDFKTVHGVDRTDVTVYPVPFNELARTKIEDVKLRRYLTNMIYVGVLAELLGVDLTIMQQVIADWFQKKTKAVEVNMRAVQVGVAYAREHLPKKDPFKVEKMDKTRDLIMIEGNTAAALGCLYGGCTVAAWYPITPSSSLCETLEALFKEFRVDPVTGRHHFAILQAEDEMAAVGTALGAGWAGARAMTSTSGPGISLMTEFVGLGYYAEIPVVIFDIQRIGPSTGLPTRTSQGDVLKVDHLSHGDTKHLALFPADMKECFEMSMRAFDLAERFQTPVFVLSDLDLGMNLWMSEPFDYPEEPFDRGKVLSAEDLERVKTFERYRDVDGDGIPYRTLPGTKHPLAAYFTRGSGHDEKARYTEKGEDYERVMDRLKKKYNTARQWVPVPVEEGPTSAEIGILAYGSTHHAVVETRDDLKAQGIETRYLRLRALPFTKEVFDFFDACKRVYVVEQNRDGQMASLLRMELKPQAIEKIRSICYYNGMPVDVDTVTAAILSWEKDGHASSGVHEEPFAVGPMASR